MTEYYDFRELTSAAEKKAHFDAGEPEPHVPDELLVLWDIEEYHKLPWDGGLMEQPDILMMLVAVCRNARDDVLIDAAAIRRQEAANAKGRQQNGSTNQLR